MLNKWESISCERLNAIAVVSVALSVSRWVTGSWWSSRFEGVPLVPRHSWLGG